MHKPYRWGDPKPPAALAVALCRRERDVDWRLP